MKIKDLIKELDEKHSSLKSAINNSKYNYINEITDFVNYINTDIEIKHEKMLGRPPTFKTNGAGRPPDLKLYIEKNCNQGSIFKLNEYYIKNPNHQQYNDRFEKTISKMISDKKLLQIKNNEFQVKK